MPIEYDGKNYFYFSASGPTTVSVPYGASAGGGGGGGGNTMGNYYQFKNDPSNEPGFLTSKYPMESQGATGKKMALSALLQSMSLAKPKLHQHWGLLTETGRQAYIDCLTEVLDECLVHPGQNPKRLVAARGALMVAKEKVAA